MRLVIKTDSACWWSLKDFPSGTIQLEPDTYSVRFETVGDLVTFVGGCWRVSFEGDVMWIYDEPSSDE